MTVILAERDFAQGLKTSNIKVPPMKAVVTWENPEALKDYDKKGEQLILQSLTAKAFEELARAQKDVKDAIEDFDGQLTKKPAADLAEAKERVKTFETVCRQITNGQESKVQSAVEAVWAMHQKRDKALTRLNLKFSATIILNTISVTASIAIAVLSLGSLAVTLVSTAKTVLSTAVAIKDFAGGRDAAAKDVEQIDANLEAAFRKLGWKGQVLRGTKELTVAAGVPFVSSVGKLRTKLEQFLGASARMDKEAQKLYAQANKLLAEIRKGDKDKAGRDNATLLEKMGKQTTDLLNQIHALTDTIQEDNAGYKRGLDRVKLYETLNKKVLTRAEDITASLAFAVNICSIAKDIVEIAVKLA